MSTPIAPDRLRRRPWLVLGVGLAVTLAGGACLWSAMEKVWDADDRAQCALLQLALGLHAYHEEHGRLPPAVVYGENGEPLYSWRVLLLPYIEEPDLYKEFHLDEPWDGPHNLHLLPRMPASYAPPPHKASRVPPYHTVCHVFVGKGAAFEGREGLRLGRDFPDGTADTLLVVEVGKPVPWTSPEDLAYDPDGSLPDLRCLFEDGFRAVSVDGTRRWVPKGTGEATLRALITRNAGDQPGPDWGP